MPGGLHSIQMAAFGSPQTIVVWPLTTIVWECKGMHRSSFRRVTLTPVVRPAGPFIIRRMTSMEPKYYSRQKMELSQHGIRVEVPGKWQKVLPRMRFIKALRSQMMEDKILSM